MTVDEYYGELRANGFTKLKLIPNDEGATILLQGREPGEIAMIATPEDMTADQRAETMAGFLRRYVF